MILISLQYFFKSDKLWNMFAYRWTSRLLHISKYVGGNVVPFQEVTVKDCTGKVVVALWDKMVDCVNKGQCINVTKCRVEEKRLTSTKASSIEVNKFSLSFTAVYLNYILYFEWGHFYYLKIIFHCFVILIQTELRRLKICPSTAVLNRRQIKF